jgi:hypothetical protein
VFVALSIQHAKHVRHIAICGLPQSTVFFHVSHKPHDLRKKIAEHKMCVLIQRVSETLFILRRKERDIIKNVYWSWCTAPLFCQVRLQGNFNFVTDFRKIPKYQNSRKSVRCCYGRTDEANTGFSQFRERAYKHKTPQFHVLLPY